MSARGVDAGYVRDRRVGWLDILADDLRRDAGRVVRWAQALGVPADAWQAQAAAVAFLEGDPCDVCGDSPQTCMHDGWPRFRAALVASERDDTVGPDVTDDEIEGWGR